MRKLLSFTALLGNVSVGRSTARGCVLGERYLARAPYVVELYKGLAPSYGELYGDVQAAKYEWAALLAGPRNLDVGCGVGLGVRLVGGYTVCLDLSADMLARAVDVDKVVGDGHCLPFRDGYFDLAVSVSTVDAEWYDVDGFAAELMRVARTVVMGVYVDGEEVLQLYGHPPT